VNQDTVNQEPLISVIVAVFNGAQTLQRCIDSVAGQTHPHKELIIMDGGSTDGTVDILRANSDKITYWESEPDRGIYHAWNKALEHAKGDWICFLGSDDYFWKPDVLERMREHLVRAASVGIRVVYGQIARVTELGEVVCLTGERWENIRQQFLQRMIIPHPGLMHHKSLFEVHGKFDENFRISGDYEFLLRELKTREAYFINNLTVVGMQVGGVSSDPANKVQGLLEDARARRNNGIRPITVLWIRTYLKAVIRPYLKRVLGEKLVRRLAIIEGRLAGHPSAWEKENLEREQHKIKSGVK